MESNEAREHLEMVDRILAQADRTLRPSGALFIAWGIVAAALDLASQAQISDPSRMGPGWWALAAAMWLAAIIFTFSRVRRLRCSGRLTTNELQFVRILWITLACAIVVDFGGWNIFQQWAQGAIWTVMYAIPVLFIGVQGHRYATAGGIILLASIVVANFVPNAVGVVLAAGMLVGYTGLGVAIELERLPVG